MSRNLSLFVAATFVAVTLSVLAVACGDEEGEEGTPVEEASPAATTPAGAATTVEVSLSEWAVEPDTASVPSGEVTFVVQNDGAIDHEFVVIRSDLDPADLPVEGSQVDEQEAGELIGRTDVLPSGETETITFDLEPGDYVLICNVPGHYTAGMFTSFSVE